jgi:folate-binding protein YgfZ
MGGDDNQPMDTHLPPQAALDGAVRLDRWGLIVARGPEAGTFLHGQLTQDLAGMPIGQARLAGYCSAKGRLLASFVVLRTAAEEWWLACSADLLGPTLKRLSMFVLRAKCKLSDASPTHALWGVAGSAVDAAGAGHLPATPWAAVQAGEAWAVRLPEAAGQARALVVQPVSAAAPAGKTLVASAWEWLEVCSAVPRITAATVEQFVPQMVNLELVGGVNFQKGCYPGQEVVARSQYRGTLKRRAYLYEVAAAASPGDTLVAADDPEQPAGLVALAAPVPGRESTWLLLAETKIAAAEGSTLHLGTAGGPVLQRTALPYALPPAAQ